MLDFDDTESMIIAIFNYIKDENHDGGNIANITTFLMNNLLLIDQKINASVFTKKLSLIAYLNTYERDRYMDKYMKLVFGFDSRFYIEKQEYNAEFFKAVYDLIVEIRNEKGGLGNKQILYTENDMIDYIKKNKHIEWLDDDFNVFLLKQYKNKLKNIESAIRNVKNLIDINKNLKANNDENNKKLEDLEKEQSKYDSLVNSSFVPQMYEFLRKGLSEYAIKNRKIDITT